MSNEPMDPLTPPPPVESSNASQTPLAPPVLSSPQPSLETNSKKPLIVIITSAVITIGLAIGIYGFLNSYGPNAHLTNTSTNLSDPNLGQTELPPVSQNQTPVRWEFDGTEWKANSTPPDCPTPLEIKAPVDINSVSGILHPGQTRGGDYKPHGGFRFDDKPNDIEVKAPLDARLNRVSHYIEQSEVQFLLEFIHPCGILYRFDHLLTLDPKFQPILDSLPPPEKDDSRTTAINAPIEVKAGDVIATAVGFKKTKNVSVDFGVYDLRKPNSISEDTKWSNQHKNEQELAFHGICWLDWLSKEQADILRKLPASSSAGKTSDYCK